MFKHPDVATAWPTFESAAGLKKVLVVETTLCLWPAHADYDENRVVKLIAAAEHFKGKNGFDLIRLVSIREDADHA